MAKKEPLQDWGCTLPAAANRGSGKILIAPNKKTSPHSSGFPTACLLIIINDKHISKCRLASHLFVYIKDIENDKFVCLRPLGTKLDLAMFKPLWN